MNFRLHSGLTMPRSSKAPERASWRRARALCAADKLMHTASKDVGCGWDGRVCAVSVWIDEGSGGDGRGGGGDGDGGGGDDGGDVVGDKETARARRAASRSPQVTSRTKVRLALVAGLEVERAALSLALSAFGVETIGDWIGGVTGGVDGAVGRAVSVANGDAGCDARLGVLRSVA